MANIRLTGVLLDPTGEKDENAQLRFTHKSATGNTLPGAQSVISIPSSGNYDFTLEHGEIVIEYRTNDRTPFVTLKSVTVDATTKATTLPELISS